jgi:hypothetical protein
MTYPLLFEDTESDEGFGGEDSEYEEAARSQPVRTARPSRMAPRPSGAPVSQTQFTAAITGLQNDISRNSAAIRQVDSRVAAVGRDVARVRKDSADRRKDVTGLQNGLAKTQQAVEILPILENALGSNTALADILPFLVLGGIGTGTGTGGDTSTGLFGNDMMMMLVLVLALGGKL